MNDLRRRTVRPRAAAIWEDITHMLTLAISTKSYRHASIEAKCYQHRCKMMKRQQIISMDGASRRCALRGERDTRIARLSRSKSASESYQSHISVSGWLETLLPWRHRLLPITMGHDGRQNPSR